VEGNYVADRAQMRAAPEASNGIKNQIFTLNYINNQPLAAFLICNKSFYDLLHGMSGTPSPTRLEHRWCVKL